MADLLVPLYDLPLRLRCPGFCVRKPMSYEGRDIGQWIDLHFSPSWSSEVLPSLYRTPPSMLIAIEESSKKLAGFCAWDCTALGFLGPVGVAAEYRGVGAGRALVLEALNCMREQGYGYCIVGSAGPVEFFAAVSGASVIPRSTPGIYPGRFE